MAVFEDQVLIETFPNRGIAEAFAEALESEGIQSLIECDDDGGAIPALALDSGAKLIVSKEDEGRAREIVDGMRMDRTSSDETRTLVMLCRNRVRDFDRWKAVFDSHAEAHREAGLHLRSLWRGVENENDVFYLFEIDDLDRARAFIEDPEAAKAGEESGVLDGEFHFLEVGTGY